MRKHLSVLGLAAQGAVGRVLLITVLTAALAGALLYLVPAQTPSQSTVYPDGEVVETYTPSDYCYLPSRTGATVVCAVGLAGVMAVLSLNGCGYGTKTDLTMRRLRIGEGAANLWWMALNAVCLLFYWAVMAAVTVLVLQLRIRNIVPDNALYTPGRQTLLLAVYASSFLHHLMPVRDTLVWAEDGLLLGILTERETVLLSTHLIEEVKDCISRAVLIREGGIVGDCSAEELEESGRDLMGYIKETYHYRPERVSQALDALTDGEEGEDA